MKYANAWHTMNIEQIATRLETNADAGLTRKQAVKRRHTLQIRRPESTRSLFLPYSHPWYYYVGKMFFDPIVLLGLFISFVAILFKEYLLGGAVAALIMLNCLACGIAYAKARGVFEHLHLYSNPMAKVIHNGKLYTADARHIVPGDLVVMTPGDICPADVRLQKGSRVTVYQYVYDLETGALKLQKVQKNGDKIYSPDCEVFNPNYENIIYAGSIIDSGSAKGLVIETGSYTYVGAVKGSVPGTLVSKDPESLTHIKKQCMRVTTLQAILLLPLTVVLSITMSGTLTIAECFLIALSLSLTSISEHVLALGRMIVAAGLHSAAQNRDNQATAIIKNHRASDRLCDMTDLLLLDTAAITDGKYHLDSVYAGGVIYTDREFNTADNHDMQALAGDLYLYRSTARPPEASVTTAFDDVLAGPIDAFIKFVGVDTTALTWNRKSSHITFGQARNVSHNVMENGEYRIIVTDNEDFLTECTHMQSQQNILEFDDSNHVALRTLCRIYRESGYRILLVAHALEDKVTLMGVMAFSQKIGSGFADCCSEIHASGVRISVFLDDTPESLKILTESGLVRDQDNDVFTAMRAEQDGLDLQAAYGSYRAYLGFTDKQIYDLIDSLKKRGNRVASYGVDNAKQPLLQSADLAITCDSIEYRSAKVAESLYEKMPADGKPFSTRASQNTRRRADIILRRAGAKGGGLHGILTGRNSALAINHNLANLITYLLSVQVFRIMLVAVPALFATPMLKPTAMLLCGLVLDVGFAIIFAFSHPGKKALTCSYPIMRRLEKPLAYNTANIISACVSALVLWLGIAALQLTGILKTPEQAMALAFASTYFLQGTVFLITRNEYISSDKDKDLHSKFKLLAIIAYTFLLAACLCLPKLGKLTAGTSLDALGFLLSPIASLVYFALYRLLSAKGLNLHK